jgi:hypothetical protein
MALPTASPEASASSTSRAPRSRPPSASSARELYQAPRSWVEQAYPNLIYVNDVDKGNHFAAWEERDLFTSEVRPAFRSVR